MVGDAQTVNAVEIFDDTAKRACAGRKLFSGIIAPPVGTYDELPSGFVDEYAVGRNRVAVFGVEVAPCRTAFGKTYPIETYIAADVAG